MDLNFAAYPVVTAILVILSIVITVLHIGAWVWSRRVRDSLVGEDGYELASIVTFIVGGVALVRVVGLAATVVLTGTPYSTEIVLGVSMVAQLMLVAILLISIKRVRDLTK